MASSCWGAPSTSPAAAHPLLPSTPQAVTRGRRIDHFHLHRGNGLLLALRVLALFGPAVPTAVYLLYFRFTTVWNLTAVPVAVLLPVRGWPTAAGSARQPVGCVLPPCCPAELWVCAACCRQCMLLPQQHVAQLSPLLNVDMLTWPPSAAVLWAQPVPPACSGNQLACNNYPHVQGDQRLAVSGQLLCSVQGVLCAAAVAASAQLAPATPSCCMPTWRTDLLLCPRPASPVCSKIPLSLPDLIVGPGATQDPLGQCLVVDTWLLVTADLMLPIIHLYRAERRARRAFAMRQWEALGGREPQFAIEWPSDPSWGWRDAFLGSALAWAILDALLVA